MTSSGKWRRCDDTIGAAGPPPDSGASRTNDAKCRSVAISELIRQDRCRSTHISAGGHSAAAVVQAAGSGATTSDRSGCGVGVSATVDVVDDDLSLALAKIAKQLDTIVERLDAVEQKVGYEQRKDKASAEVEQRYGIPTSGEA
jgi:hypothetical protein